MLNRVKDIVDKLLIKADSGEIKKLQREIVKIGGNKPGGKRVIVDGVYGKATECGLSAVNQMELLKGLQVALGEEYQFVYNRSGELVDKPKRADSVRDVIMNYLAATEGEVVHKNSTEDYITAPYGVYKKAFPNADMFVLLDKIAKSNGLDVIKDMDELNKVIAEQYYDEVKNMAWSFYVKEFLDSRLMNGLGKKSGLTVFSNSVHAGKHTGIKSLQFALDVAEDGIVGPRTIDAINKLGKNDDVINQKLLMYMNDYYRSLVEQNPSKYYTYLDGWINRLRGLGYNTD